MPQMTTYNVPGSRSDDRRARLGETLVELGLLGQIDLERALLHQQQGPGVRLGAVLQDMGVVSDEDVARGLASMYGLPIVDPSTLEIDRSVARLIPRSTATRLGVLLHAGDGVQLHAVVADPVDVVTLDDVRTITGVASVIVSVASRSAISAALDRVWEAREDEEALAAFVDENTASEMVIEDREDDAATIRLVDRLLLLAVHERASDLHIEPQRHSVSVRLRVDGILREVLELPRGGSSAVTARLKIISNLDVIERRMPQDGRARIHVQGGVVDARVSTLPSMHGEKVVVRLLPSSSRLPNLAGLGLDEGQQRTLLDVVRSPQGLVLLTGPTGSGKTNTLYAALAEGVDRTRNVITLEDPVEIELPGITQVQVDEKAGLTFAQGLRSCLRQDPDVILVGEIRDQETANLATRAALTGHLVMSTLHTLDAASAITRLVDIGVAPYLVSSSLSLVVSQRLVRVPCPECCLGDVDAPGIVAAMGYANTAGDWVRAVGCPACAETGYSGRTAVLEVLPVTRNVRAALIAGQPEDAVRRAARADGVNSILGAGLTAARAGRTTLAEVLRAIPQQEAVTTSV